jgi:hypothetical protein
MNLVIVVAIVVTFVGVVKAEDVELSGTYLKNEYIVIPSTVTDSKGDVLKLINPNGVGTVEFWFKPDWKLNDQKDGKVLFFWGNVSNKNAIYILKGRVDIGHLIISNSRKQFSTTIYTNKEYNPNELIWRHVALCWDFTGAKKIVTFFLNGKNIALSYPQPNNWKVAETEFDYIESEKDMLIGAGRHSDGVPQKGEINNTVMPEFEIAQFRISDILRYDDVFEPQQKLSADKNTLLYIPLADNLDGDYYKDGKKAGKIRGQQVKMESK